MEQISLLDYLEESSEANDKRIQKLAPGDFIIIGRYKLTYNVFGLYEVESKNEHDCLGENVEEVLEWINSLYE